MFGQTRNKVNKLTLIGGLNTTFTTYDGNSHVRIIRLNTDGTPDV